MTSPTPFSPTADPGAALTTYTTSEYAIDLPARWRQLPTPGDNAVTFQSDLDRAGIFISVDFYEIPADKAQATAQRLIDSRLAQHEKQAPGQVDVFDRGTRRHARGAGLEMHYAAHIANTDVVMTVVYVMPRRVLNLTLACTARRADALALLDAVRAHFRPGLA